MAIDPIELKNLEADLAKYLKHIKRGEFFRARAIAQSLVSATYVLDTAWMQADERNQKTWTR